MKRRSLPAQGRRFRPRSPRITALSSLIYTHHHRSFPSSDKFETKISFHSFSSTIFRKSLFKLLTFFFFFFFKFQIKDLLSRAIIADDRGAAILITFHRFLRISPFRSEAKVLVFHFVRRYAQSLLFYLPQVPLPPIFSDPFLYKQLIFQL